MDSKSKITVSWSGGKDSALALSRLAKLDSYQLVSLHTIVGQNTRRVGLHGVREELLMKQSDAVGVPLIIGYLPDGDEMGMYETLVKQMYRSFREQGITHIMFGDIFLEDLRAYRESLLSDSGLIPVYPLWNASSTALIHEFLEGGFRTTICSCDERCYRAGLLGKEIAEDFLDVLPADTDPCGENGEYHSFVFDGPSFARPVAYSLGETLSRHYKFSVKEGDKVEEREKQFYFVDLLP
jgi:uncharacterized protein (TIGR00290 family)